MDDDKFNILDAVNEYYFFVDLVFNETNPDEVVDAYLDCDSVTQEDCQEVVTDINSVGKCASEITALFICRDSEEDGGCAKCQG